MNHIHLEMIRITEAGAIAASKYIGCGDKYAADHAATEAMRHRFNKIDFAAKVVVCEGVKDNAPCLAPNEWLGLRADDYKQPPASAAEAVEYSKKGRCYDLAVDPLDGTTQTARGGYEAISVLALTEENGFYCPPTFYMKKLAVGAAVKNKVVLSITDPVTRTIQLVASALDREINEITVCVLDRPRHIDLIAELRKLGCRIKLIADCDVTGAIATCLPESGVDILMGIGGAPEGVISAAALKCMKADFQCQLCDKDGNLTDGKVLSINDLVKGHAIFCATGVTKGSILKGVRFTANGPITNSVLMRSESGTIRFIEAMHCS